MSLINGIPRQNITDRSGNLLTPWLGWFSNMQNLLFPIGNNGSTTARPTTNLWIGQIYFDTTLGYPVFVQSLGPPAVWVNASGSVV